MYIVLVPVNCDDVPFLRGLARSVSPQFSAAAARRLDTLSANLRCHTILVAIPIAVRPRKVASPPRPQIIDINCGFLSGLLCSPAFPALSLGGVLVVVVVATSVAAMMSAVSVVSRMFVGVLVSCACLIAVSGHTRQRAGLYHGPAQRQPTKSQIPAVLRQACRRTCRRGVGGSVCKRD